MAPVCDEVARLAFRRLPALPDYHGLDLAGLLEQPEEAAAVPHALHVHGDEAGGLVLREVLQPVGVLQHDAVAEADDLVELDAAGLRSHRERPAVAAALGQEDHRAALAGDLVLPESHAQLGVEQPHAVGTEQHQVGVARHLGDALLELDSLVAAGLGEAGREHAHAADTLVYGVLEHERGHPAGHGDQDVVHVARYLAEAAVVGYAHRLDAGDVVGVYLHRVYRAVEGAHVLQPHVAGDLLVANDGDRGGIEGAVDLLYVDAHSRLRKFFNCVSLGRNW